MSQPPQITNEIEEMAMEARRPRIGDACSTLDHSKDRCLSTPMCSTCNHCVGPWFTPLLSPKRGPGLFSELILAKMINSIGTTINPLDSVVLANLSSAEPAGMTSEAFIRVSQDLGIGAPKGADNSTRR